VAQPLFELGFAKRPAEELYDLSQDPGQTNNVAGQPEYAVLKKHLSWTLTQELNAAEDPRMFGQADVFDQYPYYVGYGVEKVGPKSEEK
jgi:hypothetical protein